MDLDSAAHERVDEFGDEARVSFGGQQVPAKPLVPVGNRRHMRVVVVAEQPFPVGSCITSGRPRRQILLLEGVGECAHRAVGSGQRQTPCRALLVEHPNGALVAPLRRGIARIEVVVPLPCHVLEAGGIERGCVGLIEPLETAEGEVGKERAVRCVGWVEVELDVGTHLVHVDDELRTPLYNSLDPVSHLGLCVGEPITVRIVVVVSGSELDGLPGRKVIGPIFTLRIGHPPDVLVIEIRVGVAAIGVQHRVDQDHRVVQDVHRGLVAPRGEVLQQLQDSFTSRQLEAVNRAAVPHHDRVRGDQRGGFVRRERARIAEAPCVPLDHFQRCLIAGGGDDRQQESAALP